MAKDSDAVNIVYSTAEWTKFAPTIDHAIGGHLGDNDLHSLESIAKTANIEIPEIVKSLFDKPVCHKSVVEKDQIFNKTNRPAYKTVLVHITDLNLT